MTKSSLALALAAALFTAPAFAVEFVVVNLDAGTGAGLDDPSPRAPQGGNPGTTLGEQRQVAYAYAARMWGAIMQSDVPILVGAAAFVLLIVAASVLCCRASDQPV